MILGNPVNFSIFAVLLLVGMFAALEVGRRLGKRRLARDPEGARTGLGTLEGALFGLLGLLVAFTFNGAASRFDYRRDLIVQEANAVGTAWLRLDMLPEAARNKLREQVRNYLDARLEIYRKLPDLVAARVALEKSNQLQAEIWKNATAACHTDEARGFAVLILPALNEMFDITTTRTAAAQLHPPAIIFAMLLVLSLICSLLAGYGMASAKERSWTHMIGFAVITALVVYVILDLEFPRLGFIRLDDADRPLIELRESMN